MKKSMVTLVFLALCGQVLFPFTLYIGLQYTSSLNAAIYLSTTPALVLLINKLVFKERISSRNITGVVLSSLGVIYLVMQGDLFNLDTLRKLNRGDVWTMGSAVSWALFCAFLRIKPKSVGGNAFVAVSAVIGVVMLLPVLAFSTPTHPLMEIKAYMNSGFLFGLAYLVVLPSLEQSHSGHWCNAGRHLLAPDPFKRRRTQHPVFKRSPAHFSSGEFTADCFGYCPMCRKSGREKQSKGPRG